MSLRSKLKRLKRLTSRKRGHVLLRGEHAISARELIIARLAILKHGGDVDAVMAKAKRDHAEALGQWDRDLRKAGFR